MKYKAAPLLLSFILLGCNGSSDSNESEKLEVNESGIAVLNLSSSSTDFIVKTSKTLHFPNVLKKQVSKIKNFPDTKFLCAFTKNSNSQSISSKTRCLNKLEPKSSLLAVKLETAIELGDDSNQNIVLDLIPINMAKEVGVDKNVAIYNLSGEKLNIVSSCGESNYVHLDSKRSFYELKCDSDSNLKFHIMSSSDLILTKDMSNAESGNYTLVLFNDGSVIDNYFINNFK